VSKVILPAVLYRCGTSKAIVYKYIGYVRAGGVENIWNCERGSNRRVKEIE
jgi:hypothetical protein